MRVRTSWIVSTWSFFFFKESSTCNPEELDDDIEGATNDLGASFICSATYDIIPKDGEGCVLYFYGTAYDTSKTEKFDYVVWYVLPVLLTLGTFYYMIKEMIINIHKFLNRERKKVVMKLHEHYLERKIWNIKSVMRNYVSWKMNEFILSKYT